VFIYIFLFKLNPIFIFSVWLLPYYIKTTFSMGTKRFPSLWRRRHREVINKIYKHHPRLGVYGIKNEHSATQHTPLIVTYEKKYIYIYIYCI